LTPSAIDPVTVPVARFSSGRIIAVSGTATPSTDGSNTAPNLSFRYPTVSDVPEAATRQLGTASSGPGMTDHSRIVFGSTPKDPARCRKRRESSSR
jgi:hypothetical protein